MPKSAFILENETHKILLDFEIQTDHLIAVCRPLLVSIIKKKENVKIILPFRERKNREILRPCPRAEKVVAHEDNNDISCNWYVRNSSQRKDFGGIGGQRKCRNYTHPIKISLNTEKSSADLRRLSLRLQWKTTRLNWCEKLVNNKNKRFFLFEIFTRIRWDAHIYIPRVTGSGNVFIKCIFIRYVRIIFIEVSPGSKERTVSCWWWWLKRR